MSTTFTLRSYQEEDAQRLLGMTHALLASEMRTGKTPILARVAELSPHATIVIAPLSLCLNLMKEFQRWTKLTIRRGWPDSTPSPGEVFVVHPEGLPKELGKPPNAKKSDADDKRAALKEKRARHLAFMKVIGSWKFDLDVDEAHLHLNTKTRAAKAIRALATKARRIILSTGTPITTKPANAWALACLMAREKVLFKSWPAFVRQNSGYKDHFGAWHIRQLSTTTAKALQSIMIRRTRSDVAPWLSKLTHEFVTLDEECLLPRELLDGSTTLPKLQDYTPALLEQARRRLTFATEWAKRVIDQGGRCLIFSNFAEIVDRLICEHKDENWIGITGETPVELRQEIVANHRSYDCIVATIRTMGAGHTLDGIDEALFIDQSYVPALNRQAADRIVGTKETARVTVLVTRDPLDQNLQRRLAERTDLLDQVLTRS